MRSMGGGLAAAGCVFISKNLPANFFQWLLTVGS
jgi:hypothetical protein